MYKKDFIKEISNETGFNQTDISLVLDAAENILINTMKKEEVIFTGFGKFYKRIRQETVKRNPSTGEKIEIPEKAIPAFKAGKKLKDIISEN